jgi:hypothetical protein
MVNWSSTASITSKTIMSSRPSLALEANSSAMSSDTADHWLLGKSLAAPKSPLGAGVDQIATMALKAAVWAGERVGSATENSLGR